jgi:isopenicillin N synthase-like dioxygenase
MNRKIPKLDLSTFVSGTESLRAQFVDDLGKGLEEFGFVSIIGHGIEGSLSRAAYKASAAFFELPDAVKRQYESRINGRQRGYTPIGKERAKDHTQADFKEFWHTGAQDAIGLPTNIWPNEITTFKSDMMALYDALYDVGVILATAIEDYLGIASGRLSKTLSGGNTVLRSIHYPKPTEEAPGRLWAAPHEDINLMTLLIEASGAGLEILTRDNQWLAVNCAPSEIILDTGDMMARLTNGLLPAVTHRVVAPTHSPGSRYSMPFFIHPAPDTLLKPLDAPRIPSAKGNSHLTASEYLNERLRENGVLTVDFDLLDDEFTDLDD